MQIRPHRDRERPASQTAMRGDAVFESVIDRQTRLIGACCPILTPSSQLVRLTWHGPVCVPGTEAHSGSDASGGAP